MEKLTMEELIDELAIFIDSCKPTKFSAGKVSVPKEEFLAQLEELKMELPPEINRSREIVARKDMLIAEAQNKANAIMENARKEAGIMIDENEIVAMANMRAEEIIADAKAKADAIVKEATATADTLVTSAQEEAEGIQIGAMQYTSAMMAGLENMFQTFYDQQKEQMDTIVEGLSKNLFKIKTNRAEIDTQLSLWTDSDQDDTEE